LDGTNGVKREKYTLNRKREGVMEMNGTNEVVDV
jgi:hypothetical protein